MTEMKRTITTRIFYMISFAVFIVLSAACGVANPKIEITATERSDLVHTLSATVVHTQSDAVPASTASPSYTREPTLTSAATPIALPTSTPSPEPSLTPSETPPPTPTPTYAILRGTILEQANCRYGPGAAYLYKYGVYAGYYMDMIGRNETGSWVVVQAIGGNNPCWVKASLINIEGDVMTLAPMSLPLPESPYYGPLTGVWADRAENTVIITWNALILRPGDDSLQYPYLVEAWLCTDGQLIFTPIGSWETSLSVQDEAGCDEPSHARIYGVEKHGYTAWVNIPWPPHR